MFRSLPNAPPQSNRGPPPSHRGGGGANSGKGASNEDGWTLQGKLSSKSTNYKLDPDKFRKIGNKMMDENVLLGPGQKPGNSWASGSKGGGSSKSQDSDQMPPPPTNRYKNRSLVLCSSSISFLNLFLKKN